MLPAPAEVRDLLGMARREVRGAADVSGIRRTAGVAAPERICDAAVVDRAGVAPFTCREELSVPPGRRHPDFELEVGVAGRVDGSRYAAGGGIDGRGRAGRVERTPRNHRA